MPNLPRVPKAVDLFASYTEPLARVPAGIATTPSITTSLLTLKSTLSPSWTSIALTDLTASKGTIVPPLIVTDFCAKQLIDKALTMNDSMSPL